MRRAAYAPLLPVYLQKPVSQHDDSWRCLPLALRIRGACRRPDDWRVAAPCAERSQSVAASDTTEPAGGLKWRNVGPFRGGRVSAVTGAVGQPGVFYMGLVLGGVWKTTSAGATWYPVFDSIKDVSSIGSVEVAPSDPDTSCTSAPGSTGDGNGIYKSTDAGRTWRHLPGFEDSGQIPTMLVDPHDPNIVLATVLGSTRGNE